MVVECVECGSPFARSSREKRCPACNPDWRRERHRVLEEERRRAAGALPPPSAAPLAGASEAFADSWFAGFADGEGCFYIGRRRHGHAPAFSVDLRDDDGDVLIRLRNAFGGRLLWRPRICTWAVTDKSGLVRLVKYFDRYPLRAKKGRDYLIWREAVSVYRRGTYASPELGPLREVLMANREYQGATAPELEVARAG